MESKTACIPIPWYHSHRFAVLPKFKYRAADRHNTASIHFQWLMFHLWTLDSVEVSAQVSLDDMNLHARIQLPYLIAAVYIPIFPESWSQKLWRKPNYWNGL